MCQHFDPYRSLDVQCTERYTVYMSDNRQLIMKEALRLFAGKGYDAVGIQQIVDAVGIQKPTLYHFFGSKRGLLETILQENMQNLLQPLKDCSVYRHDLKLNLTEITALYFQFALENPAVFRLQLSGWFAPGESEAFQVTFPYLQSQHQALESLFLAAAQDHGNMKNRHQAYAASFLGLLNTYAMMILNQHLRLSAAVLQSIVHQFMHGIFS